MFSCIGALNRLERQGKKRNEHHSSFSQHTNVTQRAIHTSRLSIPPSRCLCASVPSFSTVPPNRLNWTVILVVIEGSTVAATSWAAKIRHGFSSKSITERNFSSQTALRRFRASSRSTDKGILYLHQNNRSKNSWNVNYRGVIRSLHMNARNFLRISWLSWSNKCETAALSTLLLDHFSANFTGLIFETLLFRRWEKNWISR